MHLTPEEAKAERRKVGEKVKAARGESFYQEIGRKGGEVTRSNRGTEFYAEIGRKGGQARQARGRNAKAQRDAAG